MSYYEVESYEGKKNGKPVSGWRVVKVDRSIRVPVGDLFLHKHLAQRWVDKKNKGGK